VTLSKAFEKSIIKQSVCLPASMFRVMSSTNSINWVSQINNTSRGEFYSLFKEEFQLESYLLKLNTCDRIQISKLVSVNFNQSKAWKSHLRLILDLRLFVKSTPGHSK
jgi:hypothetical protein